MEGDPAHNGVLELDDLEGAFQPKQFYDSMVQLYNSFRITIMQAN